MKTQTTATKTANTKDNKNEVTKLKTTKLNAQTIDMLNKQLDVLKTKGKSALVNDIARAKALHTIKETALYECDGSKSFRDWYNIKHDGTIYGITYKSACILINTYANVWTHKVFKDLPLSIACRMSSVCKNADKLKECERLVAEGKIKPTMTQNAINELLKAEGIMSAKPKTESAPAPRQSDISTDELNVALAMVGSFMKSHCKDEDIMSKWNVILEALK
jgi:hypothetical protein